MTDDEIGAWLRAHGWRDLKTRSVWSWSHRSCPGAFYRLRDAYEVGVAMLKGRRR